MADRRGPRVDRLFKAVSENNEGVLRHQLEIARAAEQKGHLGDLVCTDAYVGYGNTPAQGLTLYAFAQALVAKGHDRRTIVTLLSAANAAATISSASTSPLGGEGADSKDGEGARAVVHPVLGVLAPGAKLLHPTHELVTVIGRRGEASVACSQFNRNFKEVVVNVAELEPIPPAGGAVWQYIVVGGGRTPRFSALLEARFEAAWQAGTAWVAHPDTDEPGWSNVPFKLHNSEVNARDGESGIADLSKMVCISSVGGFKRKMIRTEPGGAVLPMSLPEIEAAWSAKAPVQVKGKGKGRVMFVNADNAKVELQPSGKKTFCALETLFAEDADLETMTAWANRSLDLRKMVPIALPPDSDSGLPELTPLTPELARQYRPDRSRSQWQYRPGTQWSAFPADTSDRLDALFSEPPSETNVDQRPCMMLGTYRSGSPEVKTAVVCKVGPQAPNPGPAPAPVQVSAAGRKPGLRIVFGMWLDADAPSEEGDAYSSNIFRLDINELEGGDLARTVRRLDTAKLCLAVSSGGGALLELVKSAADDFAAAVGRADGQVGVLELVDAAAGTSAAPPSAIVCQLDRAVLEFAVSTRFPGEGNSDVFGFLLEVPSSPDLPIVVSGSSVEGLQVGLATLARSIVVDERAGCHASACLPACYAADVQLAGGRGNHRCALATTTTVQTAAQFVSFARLSREHQPSMSRTVRRAIGYSRRDDKRIVINGRGLATLVSCDAERGEVTVQFGRESAFSSRIRDPELCRFPLADAIVPPPGRSTGLDWSTVLFAEAASSGKGQVIFAEFPDQRCVVIKRTDEPASELGCYRIGKLLGVPMPVVVVLHTALGEGAHIEAALLRLRDRGRLKTASKGSGGVAQRQSCWLAVQELSPGSTLKDLCHREQSDSALRGLQHELKNLEGVAIPGNKVLAEANPSTGRESAPPWVLDSFGPDDAGHQRLRTIGKMIACDILVHNSDRWYLPGIFDSMSRCGNMANIIISPAGDPVAIDNTCNAFDTSSPKSADHFATFVESVRELTSVTRKRAANAPDAAPEGHPALEIVRRFFRDGQGTSTHAAYIPPLCHDIGDVGTRQVEAGFMSVVARLSDASLHAAIRGVEAELTAELALLVEGDFSDLRRVRSDFFLAVAVALCGGEQ